MASLNRVQLIGRLGKDPDIRTVGSGDKVANFSLACSESWKDKNTGEKKERTDWISVVVWGNGLVGVIEQYVHKGDMIFVEGAFKTRKYQDQSGNDRYSSECVVQGLGGKVILLGGRSDGDSGRSSGGGNETRSYQREEFSDDLDDSIPF